MSNAQAGITSDRPVEVCHNYCVLIFKGFKTLNIQKKKKNVITY